jgi:hypothetical protein
MQRSTLRAAADTERWPERSDVETFAPPKAVGPRGRFLDDTSLAAFHSDPEGHAAGATLVTEAFHT